MIVDSYGRRLDVAPAPTERIAHADGWGNFSTGIGTSLDKTTHGRFFPITRVQDEDLSQLYNGSDLVAHVVEAPALEKFREGITITADGVKDGEVKDVMDVATKDLELLENYVEAELWARLYGGSLLVLNIDDGGFPWEPLNEESIRAFNSTAVVDRRYAYPVSTYATFGQPKYGKTEIYMISNLYTATTSAGYMGSKRRTPTDIQSGGGTIQYIHETRVIDFRGNRADKRTRLSLLGWDWSVVQRLYDATRQFQHAFDSVGYLLSDASQMVYKLQGLMKAIASGQRQVITDRAMLMEQTRSVVRGILLDAGNADGKGAESAERQPTPLGGVSDVLEQFKSRFAAAARQPQTKLFGRSPAGMNATGDSDIRNWYDELGKERESKDAPNLKRILRLLSLAKEGPLGGRDVDWQIEFAPLWAPTDQEAATARYQDAQADALYVENGIIPAQVVAAARAEDYPALKLDEVEAEIDDLDLEDFYAKTPEPGDPDYVDPNPKPAPGAAATGKPGAKKATPAKKP